MMKAVVVYEAGGTDKLLLRDVPTPQVKEGWSLIKVKAFGINRSEIFTRKGYSPNVQFPRILGIECVGVVEESGRFAAGTKIVSIMGEMGRAFDGSYAEYVLLPDEQIYPVESNLPWEVLAAIPETYYTAYGSFANLRIKEHDEILVRGASSAAGIAFCNLVRARFPQAKIHGSTRNLSKRELLMEGGFDGIIEDREYVLQTEKTFDRILELIGPRSIKDSILHLRRFGIICNTGQLGEQWYLDTFDPIMELRNDVYLTAFYSGDVNAARIREMFDFMEAYDVKVSPAAVFRLDEMPKAHDYLEGKEGFGKAVCLV